MDQRNKNKKKMFQLQAIQSILPTFGDSFWLIDVGQESVKRPSFQAITDLYLQPNINWETLPWSALEAYRARELTLKALE